MSREPRRRWSGWRWVRRAAQLAFLVLFLWLFRRTEFTGADILPGGEHLFFHLDPLAVLAPILSARQIIGPLWPALVVVGLTLVLGRFFCGWVCPLGTLLDLFHRLVRPVARRTNRLAARAAALLGSKSSLTTRLRLRGVRYVVLIVVLVAAVFSFPLVGLVDPFALLFRGMAFWGDAVFYHGVDSAINATAGFADEDWTEYTLRPLAEDYLLPFRPMTFQLAGLSAAVLGVIFALELLARRFWCRYLCPAGAMFGLLSRRAALKRIPGSLCPTCGQCATDCRMDAVPAAGFSPEDCTLCMDCVDTCPKGIARFRFKSPAKKVKRPIDLGRRGLVTAAAAGVAIPAVALAARRGQAADPPRYLLRPPGAGDEKRFLDLCIRCGECMKVCPTNVLQPLGLEVGIEGLFSPHLIPRLIFEQSYCEYACTLCGQVCPTAAIPLLGEEAKHDQPIGKAYFDHNRCLPWAEKTPCIRCEEMCPVPEKAIKILNTFTIKDKDGVEVEIHQPYVDRDLCVGCGICESNCTIEGPSAIRVQRPNAPDPNTEFLLKK